MTPIQAGPRSNSPAAPTVLPVACGARFRMRPLLVLLIALLVAACGEKPAQKAEVPPRPVRVFQVVDANLIAGRALPGQARSVREAMLSFRVAGRIQERRVKTGDQVKEGDIVATLDPAPYQADL